jgi:hypothetical protein
MSYEYERRQGAVRGGYTIAQYGLSQLGNIQGLSALTDWQVLSPLSQLRAVLDLGALALFPTVPFFLPEEWDSPLSLYREN